MEKFKKKIFRINVILELKSEGKKKINGADCTLNPPPPFRFSYNNNNCSLGLTI